MNHPSSRTLRQVRLAAVASLASALPQAARGQEAVIIGRLTTPDQAPSVHARAVGSTVLDNGLQVIVLVNRAVPFVTIECVVRAGAFTQSTEGDAGLPHLIEHLMFRTSDDESFHERANRLGGGTNGATDADAVRYYLTVPAQNVAAGIELIADLVRRPRFDQRSIEAERAIVRGELERNASDPYLLLLWQSGLLLWGQDGWRARNPGGNMGAVLRATPEALTQLYRKYYVPNNSAVIIAGDVSDSVAIALARKSFGGWKRGSDPLSAMTVPASAPLAGIRRQLLNADAPGVTLLVSWQGPKAAAGRSDTYAAAVFSGVVNQPLSGTQRRLVDSGLMDDIWLSYDTRKYGGAIELTARTSTERAAAAAEALGAELSRIVEPDYFSDDDLAVARKRQQVAALYRMESAEGSAQMLASFWSAADLPYYQTYFDSLQAQTSADLGRFVERYLKGKAMVVAVLLPSGAWHKVVVPVDRALGAWRVP